MLPLVDRHSVEVDAAPHEAWRAWCEVVAGVSPAAPVVARVLGAREVRVAGGFPAAGATVPGFRVDASVPGERLTLAGRHRFSRYVLDASVEPLDGGRSLLVAETRAAFPGPAGRVYRALVIGSGGHVLAVRRMLRAAARRAR